MIDDKSYPIGNLRRMAGLLKLAEHEDDEKKIWRLLEQITGQEEPDAARQILNLFKGGMGSFNDLVLHTNGVVRKELMDEFDGLRKHLFQWAVAAL